jgi:hypothetical protein
METTKLRRFAQYARRTLLELVEARLQLVLQPESAARRETPAAVKQLETQIQTSSREQVIDRVAYTWFNRFCALRYMDVNRVNRISVVSPLDGQFQPEILAEAKMGHIDEDMVPAAIQVKVRALLDGSAPSPDPQQEAYRLLVVAACNYWQPAMPFLFERIADYTELLMPDDLLSGNSILVLHPRGHDAGCLRGRGSHRLAVPVLHLGEEGPGFRGAEEEQENHPGKHPRRHTACSPPTGSCATWWKTPSAACGCSTAPTPSWPRKMDYYIAPRAASDRLPAHRQARKTSNCATRPAAPATCSPMPLTCSTPSTRKKATDPAEIPEKILTHNLYGIEIDERAGELAAFALTMKARAKQRRFFNKGVKPNICVLRPVKDSNGRRTWMPTWPPSVATCSPPSCAPC